MAGLSAYEAIAEPEEFRMLVRLAARVRGKVMRHVNSTAAGGGVAEILFRMTALLRELEIEAVWDVLQGTPDFFDMTKGIHNALQGQPVHLTDRMWRIHEAVNAANAETLSLEGDLIFLHDPQPIGLVRKRKEGIWVWRCHIDLSHPQTAVWNRLRPWIDRHDAAVFSSSKFARPLSIPQFVIQPSIDPLSEKNRDLASEEIREVLEPLGIPRDKPILLQVGRFDRFKDPVGVIQAYRKIRRYHDCRLILAGGGAADDPEGDRVLAEVQEAAGNDPDVHILSLPPGSDRLINALQRTADIILNKSLREGFGLTVTEALWKGKPVIGGAVGGIPLQIRHGVTGYLVHSVEGAALRIRQLLNRPLMGKEMGERGREYVRRNFLITRQMRDYLALWAALEARHQNVIAL